MGKDGNLIDKWRAGSRSGYRIAEICGELTRLKFEMQQTKSGHWKARHADLSGCPNFPFGFITINAHAFGNSGEVHPDAIRDNVKAVKWIEEK